MQAMNSASAWAFFLYSNSALIGVWTYHLTAYDRHILVTKLTLNIGVLCDLVELLCALIAITHRSSRKQGLHGITLPRSWIMRLNALVDLADLVKPISLNLFRLLYSPFKDILECIYTGVGAGD